MYVKTLFVLPLLLLYSSISFTQGLNRKVIAEFVKIEAENLLPELVNIQYQINQKSNKSAVYCNFTVTEDVKQLTGTFSISMKYTDKFINYITIDIDYCDAMQSPHTQYVIQMIAKEIRSVSNYPLECPIKKNIMYYINGFTINTNLIPSYFPPLTFADNATYIYNNRLILKVNVVGKIRRK